MAQLMTAEAEACLQRALVWASSASTMGFSLEDSKDRRLERINGYFLPYEPEAGIGSMLQDGIWDLLRRAAIARLERGQWPADFIRFEHLQAGWSPFEYHYWEERLVEEWEQIPQLPQLLAENLQ